MKLASALTILLLTISRSSAEPAIEIAIPPAPVPDRVMLPPMVQGQVEAAIERGVEFLRGSQLDSGSWSNGPGGGKGEVGGTGPALWPVAYATLPGLALLESGVPPNDRAIISCAKFVRANVATLNRTYDIGLALLFLDRLGAPEDIPLIRSLGLRLAASQTHLGGWWYYCPLLTAAQEKKVLADLEKLVAEMPREQPLEDLKFPNANKLPRDQADNSNTQFALLGLWAARKHDLPLSWTLATSEKRFRTDQVPAGWGYGRGGKVSGAMSCVGLLGLAIGRGAAAEAPSGTSQDKAISAGLKALGAHMNDPTDNQSTFGPGLGPAGTVNLYFLWSVERVGVVCNLKTIGGKDWYRWGVNLLIPTQRKDGSWLGRGNGGSPVIDTSMALLFLKRSDLLPDLRETLPKRVTISDPGPPVKGTNPKTPMKEKTVEKSSTSTKEEPLEAKLGDVKAKETTKVSLKVRGPEAFRITGMRGGGAQVSIERDSQSREVHELSVTLRLDEPGDFTRIIYLHTDLPGRAQVEVRIQAKVVDP